MNTTDLDDDDLQLNWWEAYIEMSEAMDEVRESMSKKEQAEKAYDRAMSIL